MEAIEITLQMMYAVISYEIKGSTGQGLHLHTTLGASKSSGSCLLPRTVTATALLRTDHAAVFKWITDGYISHHVQNMTYDFYLFGALMAQKRETKVLVI
jgi:hypothetical protein